MQKLTSFKLYNGNMADLGSYKLLINTLNAHSFNTAQTDKEFQIALQKSDVLLPDGVSVVGAIRLLTGQRLKKIAGADLFFYELERLNASGGKCFFLGSSDDTLQKIKIRASREYPQVQICSYPPPYKLEFSEQDSKIMTDVVNKVAPDVLFVGMTAPKQEKWVYKYFSKLQVGHVCCIGAVFDFYAGTVKRAPKWMIKIGFEWLYRLVKEPRRMWKRYLIGNTKFIYYILKEFLTRKNN